jgi:hypothetical protein
MLYTTSTTRILLFATASIVSLLGPNENALNPTLPEPLPAFPALSDGSLRFPVGWAAMSDVFLSGCTAAAD